MTRHVRRSLALLLLGASAAVFAQNGRVAPNGNATVCQDVADRAVDLPPVLTLAAVALFCAVSGVQPQSETVWRQAEKYRVPRMCFVNKLDRTGASFERCVSMIKDRLGARPAVLYLPIGIEGGFKGLVDLVENRAIIWLEESLGAKFEYQAIPEDLADAPRFNEIGADVARFIKSYPIVGHSVGFDLGANASKVFVLVYKLPDVQAIFKRYPGVDGSLYYVGGVGLNYQRLDGVTLAPIRLGAGLRAGASVGYTHYRPEKSLNPL